MERDLTGAIIDIDDTLRPWEQPYARAYPAMSKALSAASGLPEEQIIAEIRQVNSRYQTIEYSALIQEMPSFSDLPEVEQLKLIEIVQKSRKEAMNGLIKPFDGIQIMLETFKFNNLIKIALSDAPKYLAYLRLKEVDLIKYLDVLVARFSPSDDKFNPRHRMENKPFEIPILESHFAKPNTDLSYLLELPSDQISQKYIIIGNSEHSDVGLAKKFGLLCYQTHWDTGTAEDRAILLKYAPLSALKHNLGTAAAPDDQPTHPDFEKVDVNSPQEIIEDLDKRDLIQKLP